MNEEGGWDDGSLEEIESPLPEEVEPSPTQDHSGNNQSAFEI